MSISFVDALHLLMVEIKVGRHLKIRLGTSFVHRDYGTPCTNHVLSVILQFMDACTLYKEEDKEKKSFQLHCWNILQHESKWHQHMIMLAANKTAQKKHKTVDDSLIDLTGNLNEEMATGDNNGNASVDGDAPKHPMGRKKTK
jgi:hypothetical protein